MHPARSVTVVNPSPGGGPSTALQFLVNNPTPTISGMSPQTVNPGLGFRPTVRGTDFVATSMRRLNGADIPTTVDSDAKPHAEVPEPAFLGVHAVSGGKAGSNR